MVKRPSSLRWKPGQPIPRGKNTFEKILIQGLQRGYNPGRPDSREWFRAQAQSIGKQNIGRVMLNTEKHDSIAPGNMYLFMYDPKHKATLPYYDRFPLIFPVEQYNNGFLGINLHYLPPRMRALLMDKLYDLSTDKRYTRETKLALSYNLLNAASKFKSFKPTIHRYLYSHLRSKYIFIPSEQWDIALMLDLQRFQKASAQKVWNDSRDKIYGV